VLNFQWVEELYSFVVVVVVVVEMPVGMSTKGKV